MPNKWLFRIASILFAFTLVTGCAMNDNNEDIEEPEAPMNGDNEPADEVEDTPMDELEEEVDELEGRNDETN